ncbi:hypothetical protein P3T76_006383 [Phytophthora citrophthora]|uniref:Uncharacterized protein n=1 Tax=Phytophthora citrophthora TaxID=4793 RepID=A0AAD9GQ35_9STRA|nr:hypothetical protein P3T76_006383 [Phytophthora citrophthora]
MNLVPVDCASLRSSDGRRKFFSLLHLPSPPTSDTPIKFDDQASPALSAATLRSPAALSDPRLQRRHDVASGMLHLVSMLSAHYNNVLLLPIQTTADT